MHPRIPVPLLLALVQRTARTRPPMQPAEIRTAADICRAPGAWRLGRAGRSQGMTMPPKYSTHAFGTQFAEVGVNADTAALANAVYDATGVRVREFPIALDKLLQALGEM